MTEKDIKNSINKHSLKPLIALVVLIGFIKIFNSYLFKSEPISPTLIVIFSVGGCLYVFQKVLVELLVDNKHVEKREVD